MTDMPRRFTRLAAAALATAAVFGPAAAFAAKDPACKQTRWSLQVPQGMSEGEAVIIQSPENHVWRVGVGGVPADAMLIIEYRSTVGSKGEVVLSSGAAELVEGATVTMRLKRDSSLKGVAVAGTWNMKCGK